MICKRLALGVVSALVLTACGGVSYASCDDVVAAGKAPLAEDDPGYSSRLDRDGDGIACNT